MQVKKKEVLLKEIIKILDNNKAKDIVTINLANKSSIADYMIVASGTSSRHIQSVSENTIEELKKMGIKGCKIEGRDSDNWKLIDAIDVIIHIFHQEQRNNFNTENFCKKLSKLISSSIKETLFIIGEPEGFKKNLNKENFEEICLSKLTFTHSLTRVILTEQIYRCATIMVNHPYHRQ